MSSIDYSVARDPLPSDDTPPAGSEWQNSRTKQIWICVSNSPGAALWQLRPTSTILPSGPPVTTRRSLNAAAAYLPVANKTEFMTAYSSGANQSATYRTRHFILSDVGAASIRLRFANRVAPLGVEAVPPDTVTYKCAVEYEGATYPVTVGNSRAWSLAGGAEVDSDVVGLRLPAGAGLWCRTMVSVDVLGKKWPTGPTALLGAAGEGLFANSDAVDAVTVPGTTGAGWVGPLVIAAPLAAGRAVVALLGSSTIAGVGDTAESPTFENGWAARAFANDASVVKIGIPSDTANNWASLTGSYYRRQQIVNSGVTHVLTQLGQNDVLDAGLTVEQIKSRLTTFWNQIDGLGLPIIACTFTPKTSSSDGWTTVVGQTPHASNANRQEINMWLKTKPHSAIVDVWDVAAVVEDRTGGGYTGKWRADGGVWVLAGDGLGQHQSQIGHRACAAAFRSRALEITL